MKTAFKNLKLPGIIQNQKIIPVEIKGVFNTEFQ